VVWGSDKALLVNACKELGVELSVRTTHEVEEAKKRKECLKSFEQADLILLHPSTDAYWDEIAERLNERQKKEKEKAVPTVSFGHDSSFWSFSSVSLKVVATVNAYYIYGGAENIENMLKYLGKEVLGLAGKGYDYEEPKETLWEGIYHPDAETTFECLDDYLAWYNASHRQEQTQHRHRVGLLFFRTYWANRDLEIVDALIRELELELEDESGFDVIPVFSYGAGDKELGAKSSSEVVEEFFSASGIEALINLQSIFNTGGAAAGGEKEEGEKEEAGTVSALKRLDVPVFHPLLSYNTTEEEWRRGSQGLSSLEVGWGVAMPELEGVIEPIIVGVLKRGDGDSGDSGDSGTKETELEQHAPLKERVRKIVRRVKKWVELREKPRAERKVAFVLHNNPCASVEATVGGAAHLDSLESVARILQRLGEAGYSVEPPEPPEDGKALVEEIMSRKAVSEFRWTTVDEIVSKGGALALVEKADYEEWFASFSPEVRERLCEAWGNPPGEEKDGVPAAMVYEGKIVVTGVKYGNAVVCVQPKRGCAGSRCDRQVCKILHDPEVPPPHQYLATYHYLESSFGADLVVHVGTHGNLEFLPGKSVGLSESCYPDIAIGNLPHLYIYNSDNPPEGTIAKRRSYATLVDHLQTVLTESGLYGDLKTLEDQIAEYNRTKSTDIDRARAHALKHIILDLIRETGLAEEVGLEKRLGEGEGFEKIIELAHDAISRVYNTQIPDGMHIFGEVPQGAKREEFINSILKYNPELRTPEKVAEISARLEASDEMGSLLHGFDAGYIEPGPSGLITRGHPEILPTGRNFYSLDPFKIPTRAAWEVGKRLADAVVQKYREENDGQPPENIAMYWMASDIMWADGEQLSQILYLIGAEPVWDGARVKGYRIIPLEELDGCGGLGRPRIDVTVRVSGITRDCFYNCIELLDEALREVAALDEPAERNFLRKHSREHADGRVKDGNADERAREGEREGNADERAREEEREGNGPENGSESVSDLARIFACKPGTYGNGVNLAVYASAWKEEKELSDVFVQWNGYAYGKGSFGVEAQESLVSQLKTVDLTFNKTVTDEYDLFGCCCYFGTHGGLTAAAREISEKGEAVCSYYGDTRDTKRVEVRSLADEVRRVVRSKLLNPKWIEGMKRHGYKGAGDISKRIGRVYGWEATTQEVDDWIFDDIAKTFVLDAEMRKFFEENNPWALEEVGRRLLEAYERGLWNADEEVVEGLKSAYLEMEGWIEEKMGEVKGEFQGGAIGV